ncbi:response regulator [Rhodohalobacter sp. SW132]|nr:response regulator [Rhodohalobacter sp. SW132]
MAENLSYFFILNEIGLYGIPAQLILLVLVIVLSVILFIYVRNGNRSNDLKLSEEAKTTFLKSILDHSGTGNAIIDSEGFIRYVNFGFSALFNENELPLAGKNINEIPQLKKLSRSFHENSSSVIEIQGGDDKIYMVKYFTVKDAARNIVGRYLKTLPDLKKAENESGGVDLSHELKTPLHAVIGFSQLLSKDADLTDEQYKLLEKIIYHSKLLDGKIKNLLGAEQDSVRVDLQKTGSDLGSNNIKKILVVDDVSINRTLLKLMLKRYGIDVQEASNGEAALQILENWKADMILMDLSMPVMDGIEAVKVIRGNGASSLSASKIIAVTATQRYSRGELIDAGFDDLMQKPFKEEELLAKIGINVSSNIPN